MSNGGEGLLGDLQRLRLVWDDPRTCGSLLTKRQLQLLYPLQVGAQLHSGAARPSLMCVQMRACANMGDSPLMIDSCVCPLRLLCCAVC